MSTNVEVGKPCQAWTDAQAQWAMVEALNGGTVAMRAARHTFLPQNTAERDDDYTARVGRSFLFPGYARTVELMVGKMFSKPVEAGDTVPEQLKGWLKDIDLQGTDLHAFAAQFAKAAMDEGLAHILVDLPNTKPAQTLAEERTAGIRPYWALIKASSVIGWRVVVEGGKPILDQLRVAETGVEPDGEFGEKHVARVRVYYRDGRWQLWQSTTPPTSQATKSYELKEEGQLSLGRIPLVTFYTRRTGHMMGAPLLEDLAWLNVEHWQKSSDQNHILHVARVPILFGRGFETGVTVSPNSMVTVQGEHADLKYVEHTGAAINAGQVDLDALVDRMAATGVDMLIKKRPSAQSADSTATGKAITESGENSVLGNLARNLKRVLDQALAVTAEWAKAGEGGEIDMDTQIGVPAAEKTDLEVLLKARMAGELSAETFFAEMQRREVLDPSIDFEEEKSRIEQEGPPLGLDPNGNPTDPNNPDTAEANGGAAGAGNPFA